MPCSKSSSTSANPSTNPFVDRSSEDAPLPGRLLFSGRIPSMPENSPIVILRDAASAEWLHFEHPQRVITAAQPGEVPAALAEIEALVNRRGWFAAGFLSYEAAPAFD